MKASQMASKFHYQRRPQKILETPVLKALDLDKWGLRTCLPLGRHGLLCGGPAKQGPLAASPDQSPALGQPEGSEMLAEALDEFIFRMHRGLQLEDTRSFA